MAQQRATASEPSSPSEVESKVRTFYSVGDVSEEVDSHFAKALSMAVAKQEPPCSSKLTSPTLPTSEVTATPSASDTSSKPTSPAAYCVTHSLSPTVADVTSTAPSTHPSSESCQATGATTALQHPPFHSPPASPEHWPCSGSGPVQPNKSRIIYPEFVNFIVHPEVDSFKDLPKLPGQSDSPPPHLQPAWATENSWWPDSTCTRTVLEQSSSQNWSIPARGYQRHPLQHLGSLNMRDTTSCTAGNVFGSHEHLYQPHSSPQHHSALLPLHPGAPQCRGGLQLETRHSQLSHAQMQYDRTHPHSTAIEQPQLQSGLEFTDDELKELLDLRGQDL